MPEFRIALIGQSAFSASFLKALVKNNYQVCGVFTIPDDARTGREDVLASTARELNIPTFKVQRWRVPPETNKAIEEVFEQYKSVGADLNVLPFCNQFVPMEVINFPKYKSINYHPSLLPKHRGAASINWTLIEGDQEAGLTIFWTDDGLDTGPVLMKKSCLVQPDDTVESLYNRFLFPKGIEALVESVGLIKRGQAPAIAQPTEGASYEPILRGKEERTQIDFDRLDTCQKLHNFIRGMDKVPGAWTKIKPVADSESVEFEKVKLFSSTRYDLAYYGMPEVLRKVQLEGCKREALIHSKGLLIFPNNQPERPVNVEKMQLVSRNKMIPASLYGSAEANRPPLELTADELSLEAAIKSIWLAILPVDAITKNTDFFYSGAGSMDVTRLVEEVKELSETLMGLELGLENEDVYMATQFEDFINLVVRRLRGEGNSSGAATTVNYEPVFLEANKMKLSVPTQLFINNQFVDSINPKDTLPIVNPSTEELLCHVQTAAKEDVDRAVRAAKVAFDSKSAWRLLDARERGKLLYKLADLMEQHKKELATLESLDSGAVYTLALKTHIGMSIDVFRYFAGWCDKIQGKTIPINQARPNNNLALTSKKPIGVCGIITPWNYPLMMVAWKAAACLAAGNTLVLKPAQACPLTALKWAELVARAGFPPGVVNIVPGRGSVCGNAMLNHPDIRKMGFTGSTPTGKLVMEKSAPHLRKVSLELGGNSPLIIFADCDLKLAVKGAMSSVFFNKGENCIAAGRIFVEQAIHDEFVDLVLEETRKIKIGDPLNRSTAHGPQNHLAHLESLIEFCKRGVEEGAKLIHGGYRLPDRKGYFFMPTIFTEVSDEMFIAQEESFGPIMIISRFDNEDLDGVLRRANGTKYGLASGVFSENLSKAMRVAEEIEAGTCFVNTYNKTDVAAPFGGIKESGFGKDLGEEALNEYLWTKVKIIQY